MNILRSLLGLTALVSLGVTAALAQPSRVSEPGTANATIAGANITINYSRPHIKDPKTGEPRKIWGGLVPYGKVWRTGANEATLISTDKPLVFGSVTIPAGKYSLWTVPAEDGSAALIFNHQTGQWGTQHNAGEDFARIDMKKEDLNQTVDPFTISIESTGGSTGAIKLSWDHSAYTAPFSVKS